MMKSNRKILCAFAILCVSLMLATAFICTTNQNTGDADETYNLNDITDSVVTDTSSSVGECPDMPYDPYCMQYGQQFTVDEIIYEITTSNTVKVVGCDTKERHLDIPNYVWLGAHDSHGYIVNEIDDEGLRNHRAFAKYVNSVSIGGSIEKLGKHSLDNRAVTFRDSVENMNLRLIDNGAFAKSSISEITLPSCIEWVGEGAFQNCDSLTTVNVASGSWGFTICDSVFKDCDSLTTVSLPRTTCITKSMFEGCDNLTTVSMPKATSVGDYAFQNCDSLAKIDLPSVKTTGFRSFYDCDRLETVVLNATTDIGSCTFENCDSLKNVNMNAAIAVGDYAFKNCEKLAEINLPSAKTVGYQAFYSCDALQKVKMQSATDIGKCAFEVCTSLCELKMPNAAVIGDYAFKNCDSLMEFELPSAKTIGYQAFYGCDTLLFVHIDSATDIGKEAFRDSKRIVQVSMTSVVKIGEKAFVDSKDLYKVSFSDCIEEIGSNAFAVKFYDSNRNAITGAENLSSHTFLLDNGKLVAL